MISQELLEILACPETKTPLHRADAAMLEKLNAQISAGTLRNRDGEIVVDPLEEGLVREDGAVLYPVREEIPIMLIGEAIPLQGTDG